MNLFGIYVVHDKVAKQTGFIHEQVNDGVALREFAKFIIQKVKEGDREEDFQLYKLGTIDHEENGEVSIYPQPLLIEPDIEIETEEDANG